MYDTRAFTDPAPRMPGFHDVACRVAWTPRNAEDARPRHIVGDFLDADSPCGAVTLGCGIEEALSRLNIDFLDYGHLLAVCELVDRQLAEHPWAELRCPQGTARIELISR